MSAPTLIAHRGASQTSPENTLRAFRAALDQHADGLECDVRLSADLEPVVFHDADLDRLTDAMGPVTARTFAELSRLQVRHPDPERAGEGEPTDTTIPHLAELADLVALAPPTRTGAALLVNAELKPLKDPRALVEACRPQLERLASSSTLIISSFDPRVLALLLASPLTGPHRLALLFDDPAALKSLAYLRPPPPATVDLHPMASLLTAETFAAWSTPGRRFRAWTVDDPTEARRLLSFDPGLALITNRPGPLRAELGQPPRLDPR